jgi:hypothetical protein
LIHDARNAKHKRHREVFNEALKSLAVIAITVDDRNLSKRAGGMMLKADDYILGGKPVAVSLCAREKLHELISLASLIAEMYFIDYDQHILNYHKQV